MNVLCSLLLSVVVFCLLTIACCVFLFDVCNLLVVVCWLLLSCSFLIAVFVCSFVVVCCLPCVVCGSLCVVWRVVDSIFLFSAGCGEFDCCMWCVVCYLLVAFDVVRWLLPDMTFLFDASLSCVCRFVIWCVLRPDMFC